MNGPQIDWDRILRFSLESAFQGDGHGHLFMAHITIRRGDGREGLRSAHAGWIRDPVKAIETAYSIAEAAFEPEEAV
jgi:hypothetical protein